MYKKAGKYAQHYLEKTGSKVNELTPGRDKKHRKPNAESIKHYRSRRLPGDICCQHCNAKLQRVPTMIQQHFLTAHGKQLTTAEAFRLISAIIKPRLQKKPLT